MKPYESLEQTPSKDTLEENISKFKRHLRARGYPRNLVDKLLPEIKFTILEGSAWERNYKRFYTLFHTGRESVWPVTPFVSYLKKMLTKILYGNFQKRFLEWEIMTAIILRRAFLVQFEINLHLKLHSPKRLAQFQPLLEKFPRANKF